MNESSPLSQKLLVAIVEHGRAGRVVALARAAGARGGTVMLGRGTASNTLLQVLGLGGTEREIVYILAPPAVLDATLARAADPDPKVLGKSRGVAFVVDVLSVLHSSLPVSGLRPAAPSSGEQPMHTHALISVIVNTGYAEDVMHAARKAGAKGGTIVNARGTATGEDVKFFGITLVPEKEFLLILAEKDEAPAILEAIRATRCLTEPGMGIAFCTPVERFVALGKSRE